jgi:hypothetical protein
VPGRPRWQCEVLRWRHRQERQLGRVRAGSTMLTRKGSSAPRRAPLPPVDRCTVGNQAGGELDTGRFAELPQLLRGTAVLKDDLVGFERIEFPGAKAVNGVAYIARQARPTEPRDTPQLPRVRPAAPTCWTYERGYSPDGRAPLDRHTLTAACPCTRIRPAFGVFRTARRRSAPPLSESLLRPQPCRRPRCPSTISR